MDRKLVSVAKVILSIYPAKFQAVTILQEKTSTRNKFGSRLQQHSLLALGAADLVRLNVFVTAPDYQIVFVLLINIGSEPRHHPLHSVAENGPHFPLGERFIFTVMLLTHELNAQS